MKVLVTGAGGFIGSHLTELLVQKGHEVRAFVHYNARGHWGWLEASPVRDYVEVVAGDVRDYDAVRDAVAGVEAVFHLAALIGIPYSYKSPLAYIRTNVEGTYNVLQAAKEAGLERVVHTSTSEVYGTAQYAPIDEAHPIHAQSPYAATKIAADQLALSFFRSFNLPVTVVRPFNTYGPRQSARAIIPTIITQVLTSSGSVKVGNLEPTRDFNFVGDTVEGMLKVGLSDGTIGEVVNIGSGREISIGRLVETVAFQLGKSADVVREEARVRPPESEVERLLCDNRKALRLAGWQPTYSLEEGLKHTILWFQEHLDNYKPGRYQV